MSDTEEQENNRLVAAAQLRTSIIGHINQHPDGRFTIAQLAEALGIPEGETQKLTYAANKLVESKDIKVKSQQGSPNEYYAKRHRALPEVGGEVVPLRRDGQPRQKPGRKPGASGKGAAPLPLAEPAKEVEFVIDGLQIVVGKNPATGRLRIVLEEA